MDRSQWISLVFIVVLIVVDIFFLTPAFQSDAESGDRGFPKERIGQFLAFVGFASIWWPDVVGAVLLFARFGPVSDSLAAVVRYLGWVLLIVVAIMRLQCIRHAF